MKYGCVFKRYYLRKAVCFMLLTTVIWAKIRRWKQSDVWDKLLKVKSVVQCLVINSSDVPNLWVFKPSYVSKIHHTGLNTNRQGEEKQKSTISGDKFESARMKFKITISAFRTIHGDLLSILFRYLMASVCLTWRLCPCGWSDLLSAVDLTLNLIRNIKKAVQLPRVRERAFSSFVTVHWMHTATDRG